MRARLKFEMQELVQKTLDQVPEWIWVSRFTTFLDPAMAGGQFVGAIEKRLREYGHSKKNIAKRVFGFGTSQLRINFAVNKNGLHGKYRVKDFLGTNTRMKFDIVVGNPPYGDRTNIHLHLDFLEKCLEISNEKVLMIHPITWALYSLKYDSQDKKYSPKLKNRLGNRVEKIVILNPNAFFPSIQKFSPAGITILDVNKTSSEVIVENWITGETETFSSSHEINLISSDPIFFKIWEKIQNYPEKIHDRLGSNGKYFVNMPKVIGHVNKKPAGWMFKSDFHRFTYVEDSGRIFSSPKNQSIGFAKKKDAISFSLFLETELAKFCLMAIKLDSMLSGGPLRFVPFILDEDVYSEIGLTKKEISFIEKTVKNNSDEN